MERLREELRAMFQIYLEARGIPGGRDHIWDMYVQKREEYLRLVCESTGERYIPLKEKLVERLDIYQ